MRRALARIERTKIDETMALIATVVEELEREA